MANLLLAPANGLAPGLRGWMRGFGLMSLRTFTGGVAMMLEAAEAGDDRPEMPLLTARNSSNSTDVGSFSFFYKHKSCTVYPSSYLTTFR
jgi:hypothetical protein